MISKIAVKIINEFDNNNIDEKLKSDIIGSLHEMYGMIKPYKGKMKRNGSYTRILRFYDEREWRFVPREPLKYGMPENIFNNEAKREEYNHKIGEKATLRFKPSDIKYIIVSEDEQIIDIISKIEKIKKYSPDEKKLLCSRLISAKQIYEDF
jgi:hypothetical protein